MLLTCQGCPLTCGSSAEVISQDHQQGAGRGWWKIWWVRRHSYADGLGVVLGGHGATFSLATPWFPPH